MFADTVTESMRRAIDETERRRTVQHAYNEENGITPEGIRKSIVDVLSSIYEKDYYEMPVDQLDTKGLKPKQLSKMVRRLKKEIAEAAKKWDFEKAALLRDRLLAIEKTELTL
jgi:excinuclease ABC subunit B